MIYSLIKDKITELEGEFKYICEDENSVFVESKKALKAPFKKATLSQELKDKLNSSLKELKDEKCKELNLICDSLLKEFKSEALGEAFIYDSTLEDQLNLLGLVSANIEGYFRCRKESENIKNNVLHTKEQLKQVYDDFLEYKSEILNKCAEFKAKVQEALNLEEIQEVEWIVERQEEIQEIETSQELESFDMK